MKNLVIDNQVIKFITADINKNPNLDSTNKEAMIELAVLVINDVNRNLPLFMAEQNLSKRLRTFKIEKSYIMDCEPVKHRYDKNEDVDCISIASKEIDYRTSTYDSTQLIQKGLLDIVLSKIEDGEIKKGFTSNIDMTSINTGYIISLLEKNSLYDTRKISICEFYQEEMAIVSMLNCIISSPEIIKTSFSKNDTNLYINNILNKGIKLETFKGLLENANYDLSAKKNSPRGHRSQFAISQNILIDMLFEKQNLTQEQIDEFEAHLILSEDRFLKPECYKDLKSCSNYFNAKKEQIKFTEEKAHIK